MSKVFYDKPIIDQIFEEFNKKKDNQDEGKLLNLVKRLPPEDVNKVNIEGQTALIYASEYGYSEIVKLLVDVQADVNIQKNNGWTALILASTYSNTSSNIETVKLLIDAQADINIRNIYGLTALVYASINSDTSSNIETIKLLIDAQADVNIQNDDGWTATETVKLLENCD